MNLWTSLVATQEKAIKEALNKKIDLIISDSGLANVSKGSIQRQNNA